MKTKITLIVDTIFAFIWLNIFVRGLYTISSASGVTMSNFSWLQAMSCRLREKDWREKY